MSGAATIETEVGERSVTLADILSWRPRSCYPEHRVREMAVTFGRERITAREALDLPIPAEDRLWLALREELVPGSILHEVACRCAEEALDLVESRGGTVDPRSREAIRVKRAWLHGQVSDTDLATARDAARDAAWNVAGDAAGDAAWAAARAAARATAGATAWAAARAATETAAWNAARAAAWDAAAAVWDAARAAARKGQVEILRSLLAGRDAIEAAAGGKGGGR